MSLDKLIYDVKLLSMEGEGVGYSSSAAVAIENGEIAEVGDTEKLCQEYEADEMIDGEDKLLMPGMIDAHIHSHLALLRGLAQDMEDWMERGVWPFSSCLDAGMLRASSALNIMEAVRSGTTTFLDYGDRLGDMVSIHEEFGTRALLAGTINELDPGGEISPGDLYPFSREEGERKLERAVHFLKNYSGPERIEFCLGPQAPDMLSLPLLREVYRQAEAHDVPVHMHLAQGEREHRQMRKRYGQRSIPFLAENDLLDERLLAVHLTEASREEVRLLAESGCGLIICSGSIAIIDGIVPPLLEFLQHSDRAALGSDQACGNNINNMFNEIKLTTLLNKCQEGDPTVLPAWRVLQMATSSAAEALGFAGDIGRIAPGYRADMIMIDLKSPRLNPLWQEPLRNIVPNLVYAAGGDEVTDVLIEGEFVVRDEEFLPTSEQEILESAQREAERAAGRVDIEELKRKSPLYKWQQQGRL